MGLPYLQTLQSCISPSFYFLFQISFSIALVFPRITLAFLQSHFTFCLLPLSHCVIIQSYTTTRSTRRAQTSLAEADLYSRIAHCKNVEPWWWKANPKGSGSLPAPRSGHATAIMVFFAHFNTHLRRLRSPPKFNQFFIVQGPLHKISSRSIHNFLSNVHKQADTQTNTTKNTNLLLPRR